MTKYHLCLMKEETATRNVGSPQVQFREQRPRGNLIWIGVTILLQHSWEVAAIASRWGTSKREKSREREREEGTHWDQRWSALRRRRRCKTLDPTGRNGSGCWMHRRHETWRCWVSSKSPLIERGYTPLAPVHTPSPSPGHSHSRSKSRTKQAMNSSRQLADVAFLVSLFLKVTCQTQIADTSQKKHQAFTL